VRGEVRLFVDGVYNPDTAILAGYIPEIVTEIAGWITADPLPPPGKITEIKSPVSQSHPGKGKLLTLI
jgi:hypothetical protein